MCPNPRCSQVLPTPSSPKRPGTPGCRRVSRAPLNTWAVWSWKTVWPRKLWRRLAVEGEEGALYRENNMWSLAVPGGKQTCDASALPSCEGGIVASIWELGWQVKGRLTFTFIILKVGEDVNASHTFAASRACLWYAYVCLDWDAMMICRAFDVWVQPVIFQASVKFGWPSIPHSPRMSLLCMEFFPCTFWKALLFWEPFS